MAKINNIRGLDQDLWKRLKLDCIEEETTLGAKVNELVRAYLEKKEKAKKRDEG